MAKEISDVGDALGAVIGMAARQLAESATGDGDKKQGGNGSLSGLRGVAAGAALAGAPLAGMAAKRMVERRLGSPAEAAKGAVGKVTEGAGDKVSEGVKGAVEEKMGDAGGAPGMVAKLGKKMMPGSLGGESPGGESGESGEGGSGQGDGGAPGVGKGRRMPVQQAVDVAVPRSVAYNQWTQFEEWPQFMHRVVDVDQQEPAKVSFRTKFWGMSKDFVAAIDEQRPDERIKWEVADGARHTGVVSFHELAPRLTRVQVSLDLEPGSWVEKAARGMRHVKRGVRADLARFKAFIEMRGEETGAWRGTIEEGEVVSEGEDESGGGESGEEEPGEPAGGKERKASKASNGSGAKPRKAKARRPRRPAKPRSRGAGQHSTRKRAGAKAKGGRR